MNIRDGEINEKKSEEGMMSASYRNSGLLRSMSVTSKSMPFLDRVQDVGSYKSKNK